MQKLLKLFLPLLLVTLNLVPAQNSIQLNPLGKYETGIFADGGTEISAYDKNSKKLFVTNASNNTISIIDMSDPSNLALISSLNMEDYGAGANSVAFKNGILAVAMEAEVKQDNGKVVFFDSDGNYLSDVTAGALPDMVAFSPDGNYVLSANEGEPNDEYTVDPEGSVTIIDISGGVANVTQTDAVNATFTSFNNTFLPGVRVFGPDATLAQDIEPEYITFSSDGQTAFISCQENNA